MSQPGYLDFSHWLDEPTCELLCETFVKVGATEGSVWLEDPENGDLVMAFNSGPDARNLVRVVRQPEGTGIIGMVLMTGQGVVENAVQANRTHSKIVDQMLFQQTQAMIAVPLYFKDATLGVVSCVSLKEGEKSIRSFSMSDLRLMGSVSNRVGQYLESRAGDGIAGVAETEEV